MEMKNFIVFGVVIFLHVFYIAWRWLFKIATTFCNTIYSKILHSCDRLTAYFSIPRTDYTSSSINPVFRNLSFGSRIKN